MVDTPTGRHMYDQPWATVTATRLLHSRTCDKNKGYTNLMPTLLSVIVCSV